MSIPPPNQHLVRAVSFYRGHAVEQWRETMSDATGWQKEAVRHVAIVNSAGLAGSVALLAREGASIWFALPASVFIIGLILIVVGMALGAMGGFEKAGEVSSRIEKLDGIAAIMPKAEYATNGLRAENTHGKNKLDFAIKLAWTSAILFVIGGLLICFIVLFAKAPDAGSSASATPAAPGCSSWKPRPGPAI